MNPAGRADGRIIVVTGSSGSGKSAWVKRELRAHPRVLAWDPEAEYTREPGFVALTDPRALLARLRNHRGRGRFTFVPATLGLFDWWCRLAFAWGRLAPCAVVAEETADVTTPNKAPQWYGTLIRRGRKWGITLYGITQRPAESDKTIIGNAHVIHCGRMQRAADRAYIAKELDVPLARIAALQPLEWIERDAFGAITSGKLTFPKPKKEYSKRASNISQACAQVAKQPAPPLASPPRKDWLLDF